MKHLKAVLTLSLIVATAAPVMAQQPTPKDSSKKGATKIPADARPPKGMCRIWIDGVPAAQQPAVTDCPTAVKNQPANGRVIFGDDFADSSKKSSPKITRRLRRFVEDEAAGEGKASARREGFHGREAAAPAVAKAAAALTD